MGSLEDTKLAKKFFLRISGVIEDPQVSAHSTDENSAFLSSRAENEFIKLQTVMS